MRIGKIARLQRTVRDELGRRLEAGASGEQTLAWLNGLPEVAATLKQWFGGRPVNKVNLSAWRNAGHQEWRREQVLHELARDLAGAAKGLEKLDDANTVRSGVTAIYGMELAKATDALLNRTPDPMDRFNHLQQGIREVVALRRLDLRGAGFKLEEDRRKIELKQLKLRRETEEFKTRRRAETRVVKGS